ncbi:MAG: hypothetical protein QGI21_04175 [Candidatus Poseidoniaceae archaeon]|nr:hypothetical protein [Candidatus Poseidoniaceae archaeon]
MSNLYPLWIEKFGFLLLVTAGIVLGIELSNYLEGVLLWITRICGIPILVLVITEFLGRLLQSIITRE